MYVLGVDFGGGASKATLIDNNGKVIATAKSEYQTITLADGGREQRPDDWIDATVINIKEVMKQSGVDAKDILCICFDAATHTAVLMDENFKPVRDSVYWTDTRSVGQKKFLEENFGDDIFNKFYHRVDTIWTLPELLYVKETEPEVWKKVKKITFSKDYVRHFFTGDFVTDFIEAEGSLFFDFNERQWSKPYLDILGIDESYLPKIVNPLDKVGVVSSEAAKISGLIEGTPVICGSTDTAMEVFAAGACNKGQMTIKLATAGRMCIVTDKLAPDKNLVSYSHLVEGLYYPGTATKACASSLRWFRDNFGGDFRSFTEIAKDVPVGSDGLIFSPYLNGELTPFANPKLKGSFFGLTFMHTKAHFIRSVMEGTGFSLKDCYEYLRSIGQELPKEAFIIGGGANSSVWKQIVADCLNIKLYKTLNDDSSMGSAMCAGIAIGMFKDYNDAVKKCQIVVDVTEPIKENVEKYDEIFKQYKKIGEFLSLIYNE